MVKRFLSPLEPLSYSLSGTFSTYPIAAIPANGARFTSAAKPETVTKKKPR